MNSTYSSGWSTGYDNNNPTSGWISSTSCYLNPTAPVFVPRRSNDGFHRGNVDEAGRSSATMRSRRRGKLYLLLHGLPCNYCGEICLDPEDPHQRQQHLQECLQRAEEMELQFAVARSRGKECGICLEEVMKKSGTERRFGILPQCIHCFCLDCITKWRENQEVDADVRLSCPECRVHANFVCPSDFWVQSKEDKDELIADYFRSQARYNNNGRY